MSKKLFWSSMLILFVVHAANIYVMNIGLLFETWWLDIPLHFFGGVGVGFFALWFMMWTGLLPVDECRTWLASRMRLAFPDGMPWWWSFGGVAIVIGLVALGWEVAEACFLYFPRQPFPPGYPLDTIKDIFVGSVGATTGWAAFYRVQCSIWWSAKAVSQLSTKQS